MAAASAAVKGIKKACELYKEVKGVAGNVKDVLRTLTNSLLVRLSARSKQSRLSKRRRESRRHHTQTLEM